MRSSHLLHQCLQTVLGALALVGGDKESMIRDNLHPVRDRFRVSYPLLTYRSSSRPRPGVHHNQYGSGHVSDAIPELASPLDCHVLKLVRPKGRRLFSQRIVHEVRVPLHHTALQYDRQGTVI